MCDTQMIAFLFLTSSYLVDCFVNTRTLAFLKEYIRIHTYFDKLPNRSPLDKKIQGRTKVQTIPEPIATILEIPEFMPQNMFYMHTRYQILHNHKVSTH